MPLNDLAINGGEPVRTRPWPPLHSIDQSDRERLLSALQQNNWSHGTQVREFEQRFAEFCSCKHALLTNNGTTALKIALLASGSIDYATHLRVSEPCYYQLG